MNDYTCSKCNGTGQFRIADPINDIVNIPIVDDCYSCKGTGRLPDRRSHKERRQYKIMSGPGKRKTVNGIFTDRRKNI